MFESEEQMSILFEEYLKSNYGETYIKEYQASFGVPDFVYYTKQEHNFSSISFELKLKNWKRAVKQAFRYKNFSNITYVVLCSKGINAALHNLSLFEKYNIGLACFDDNSYFKIHHKPELGNPFSVSQSQKLISSINYHESNSLSDEVECLLSRLCVKVSNSVM